MKNRNLSLLIAILILVSALPMLIGFCISNPTSIYSGVVFNPIDGYSYLAKMEIGRSGEWLFTLPYTPDPGDGRVLFPFYIGMGRLFSDLGISLPVGFNFLRLICYAFLLITLVSLVDLSLPIDNPRRTLTVFLAASGGGLGWLLLPTGNFGADFWVAEAFPFLSGLANPHFPLALGLAIAGLIASQTTVSSGRLVGIGLTGFFISVLSPFGFVVTGMVIGLSWLWEKIDKQPTSLWLTGVFLFSGTPYCAYQLWAVNSTPQLAAWTSQNITPSPQIWDVFLSFSPWLVLVLAGLKELYQQRSNPLVRRLFVWLAIGLVMAVIPFNLQRRFLFGLYIPMVCLGMLALPVIAEKIKFSVKKLTTICAMTAFPTPLLLLVMVCSAIGVHNPLYFIRNDELSAIQWLAEQPGDKPLVLAADQTGAAIPAVSRLRVLYGHPFETINAETEKQSISDFFSGKIGVQSENMYLQAKKVDWIFYGERENKIGLPEVLKNKQPTRQIGEVKLFMVREILP